jgi:2-succinyl-6-hydroxy-2,4-cyclohexadiene-1-carboxylate synthase
VIWLLPGFLGRAADWKPFRPALARAGCGTVRGVELFAPRLVRDGLVRDGRTEPLPLPPGLPGWGAAFTATVEEQDPTPVLIGYSLGGRLALHALVAAPSLWRAAIIVSAHPGLASTAERAARLERDEAWARRFETEPWDSLMAAWQDQAVFHGRSPSAPRREHDFDRAKLAAALRAWSLGAQENLVPALRTVTQPVLWLAGQDDHRFVEAAGPAVAALPAGRLAVVEGAVHRAPWENPAAFLRLVNQFLQTPAA